MNNEHPNIKTDFARRSIDDASPGEWDAATQAIARQQAQFATGQARRVDPSGGPLDTQVGGDHYKGLAIQPIEYIHANSIPFAEGNVIKYVTRWRTKNGLKDLEKARHFLDLLIDLETRKGA